MKISLLTFLLPAGVITLLAYVLRCRSRPKKSLPPSQRVNKEAHDNIRNQEISKKKESEQEKEIKENISEDATPLNESTPIRRTGMAPDLIPALEPGTKVVSSNKEVKQKQKKSDFSQPEEQPPLRKGVLSHETKKRPSKATTSQSSISQDKLLPVLMQYMQNVNRNAQLMIKNRETSPAEPFKFDEMLEKLDDKARMNVLCNSEDAYTCTFCVDVNGGKVMAPFCELVFLFGAVLDALEITMTAVYDQQKPEESSDKLFLTPDIFFTSKCDMKFNREVEVTFFTHYGAIDSESHLKVKIERTVHCIPPAWLKLTEVENWHDSIQFRVLQFCGLRAVCDICQRSLINTRINYLLTIGNTYIPSDMERCFYLYLFTDRPDICRKITDDMNRGNYEQIHPEQSKTVRFGCNLMASLYSSNICHSLTPCHEILEINNLDEIVKKCYLFTLRFRESYRRFPDSVNIPLKVDLSEIFPATQSNMTYKCGPRMPCTTINVHGRATGISNTFMYPPTTEASNAGRHATKPMQRPGSAQLQPIQNSGSPSMEVHQNSSQESGFNEEVSLQFSSIATSSTTSSEMGNLVAEVSDSCSELSRAYDPASRRPNTSTQQSVESGIGESPSAFKTTFATDNDQDIFEEMLETSNQE